MYRKIITESLHDAIYPLIYDSLFTTYRKHVYFPLFSIVFPMLIYVQKFEEKDNLTLLLMKELKRCPPSFYQQFVEWNEEQLESFKEPIHILQGLNDPENKTPYSKLNVLLHATRTFFSLVPDQFAMLDHPFLFLNNTHSFSNNDFLFHII